MKIFYKNIWQFNSFELALHHDICKIQPDNRLMFDKFLIESRETVLRE
jgi:hypothetical protein